MTKKINKYLTQILSRRAVYLMQKYGIMMLLFTVSTASAQVKDLSLKQTVALGLKNSSALKLSQSKVDLAVNKFKQVEEQALPSASASLLYNHAEFLNKTFRLPGSAQPVELPSHANAYVGTLGIEQLIFGGNKLKYAKESTRLLTQIARLDAEKDSADIMYNLVNIYYDLYRLQKTKEITTQNLASTTGQLEQAQRFFDQGIVTKNDVLRYQLQKSNIELVLLDLESNIKVINYNLDILLGLPENTVVRATAAFATTNGNPLNSYVDTALAARTELQLLDVQYREAATAVKAVKSEILPAVGIGGNLYYINPNGNLIPHEASFLAPVTIAANVSWNIDKLWKNKTRVAEAKIRQEQVAFNRELTEDNVREDVNKSYQNYIRSLERIRIIQTSVDQAKENDRIMESKYRNNIASVIDRIDAETQLFQTLTNLELAKADAGLAYYTLLKSTGNSNLSKYLL